MHIKVLWLFLYHIFLIFTLFFFIIICSITDFFRLSPLWIFVSFLISFFFQLSVFYIIFLKFQTTSLLINVLFLVFKMNCYSQGKSFDSDPTLLGPGGDYTINTLKPFTVSHRQVWGTIKPYHSFSVLCFPTIAKKGACSGCHLSLQFKYLLWITVIPFRYIFIPHCQI